MKIEGNTIRPGYVIEHEGELWRAVKTQHTQPGKGGAYLQVELKNLKSGSKKNERFRSSEKVERATLEQRDYQFLFQADDMCTFMNNKNYEQIDISTDDVGDKVVYLQDGMMVTIEFYEETPLGVAFPEHVIFEVTETEPVIKGQTATSSYKPATLDNGQRTMVPPFINVGDKIVIYTETGEYSKRAD
ncbi:MAG: elongation factor P [Sphingomonadales bacterium]|nr:elongation factor P [Sphingomonadales bacterium]